MASDGATATRRWTTGHMIPYTQVYTQVGCDCDSVCDDGHAAYSVYLCILSIYLSR